MNVDTNTEDMDERAVQKARKEVGLDKEES